MILYYHFVDPYVNQDPKKRIRHSFVQAIIAYKRGGFTLPNKNAENKKGKK